MAGIKRIPRKLKKEIKKIQQLPFMQWLLAPRQTILESAEEEELFNKAVEELRQNLRTTFEDAKKRGLIVELLEE